jgi:hypothetical protein
MHPEMLRALAKARHEDLLDCHRTRGQSKVRSDNALARPSRSRQRVGFLLIWAGARLVGERRAALELAHE